jgi:transposase
MSSTSVPTIATIGLDLGKNTFHLVGLDRRGAIVLQLKLSRGQLERRLANVPRCLIGMEACSGSHHIGRRLTELGHDVRLIPAQYVKPFLKGHKNDYRDAEAIAEAVPRPTMRFGPYMLALRCHQRCPLPSRSHGCLLGSCTRIGKNTSVAAVRDVRFYGGN